jgi:chaperonin GroES
MNKEESGMAVPIQPLADYVVAKTEEAKTQTASGLYLPEKAQEKPKVAVVLAVGKDAKQVKVGDKIIYKTYSTTEVKVEREDYILVKEEDIIATLK